MKSLKPIPVAPTVTPPDYWVQVKNKAISNRIKIFAEMRTCSSPDLQLPSSELNRQLLQSIAELNLARRRLIQFGGNKADVYEIEFELGMHIQSKRKPLTPGVAGEFAKQLPLLSKGELLTLARELDKKGEPTAIQAYLAAVSRKN